MTAILDCKFCCEGGPVKAEFQFGYWRVRCDCGGSLTGTTGQTEQDVIAEWNRIIEAMKP